jgi:hypothetical protein
MIAKHALTFIAGAMLLAGPSIAAEYFDETKVRTIFAFDSTSIPYEQNLRLEMRDPVRHPDNPVVPRGGPGTPDEQGVQFYGSIIKVSDTYRMWYVAFDNDKENPVASARWRPAYAESKDGINWSKPKLGLVEFGGNKDNNLLLIEPAPLGFVNLKVLYEPEDPDPQRRYKMTGHVYFRSERRLGTLAPFASADGLRWKLLIDGAMPRGAELLEKDVILPAVHFEPSGGLFKWDGFYYASGQNALNARRPYHGRVSRAYRSADFVNWSQTSSMGLIRLPQHTLLGPGRSLEGEQSHEGISVWNRGNVLLGLQGQWRGAKEWKDVTIDLGFVYSTDGVSFLEPAHEWSFLKHAEDGKWDQGGLIQAQGFENIGDKTFVYYGAWDPRQWKVAPPRGGVGIAMLPRDRFADLVVEEAGQGPGDYELPYVTCEFVTSSIPIEKGKAPRFYLNAEGLGPEASLRIELLDHLERPIAAAAGNHAAVMRESGFQTPIVWDGESEIKHLPDRIKLHVVFEGKKRTGIRFSAIYMK